MHIIQREGSKIGENEKVFMMFTDLKAAFDEQGGQRQVMGLLEEEKNK